MKSLFTQTMILTTVSAVLINWKVAIGQQPDFGGELQVTITNPPTAVPISVDAVSVIWGSKNDNPSYPITHAYDHYDTLAPGFYADHVDNPSPTNPEFGYGRYKITITKNGQDFVAYADYRDCDYLTHYDYFRDSDIRIHFDYTNEEFTTGSDVQIWDENHKYPGYPQNTNCFLIPVTVQNNFSGGQIKEDNVIYTSPYTGNWPLNSSHFNPSTTISYRLLEGTPVILKVYDVHGREVNTLVNEWQSAGEHTVSFDAGHLASGVYWYRLQAGATSHVKKMILAK